MTSLTDRRHEGPKRPLGARVSQNSKFAPRVATEETPTTGSSRSIARFALYPRKRSSSISDFLAHWFVHFLLDNAVLLKLLRDRLEIQLNILATLDRRVSRGSIITKRGIIYL